MTEAQEWPKHCLIPGKAKVDDIFRRLTEPQPFCTPGVRWPPLPRRPQGTGSSHKNLGAHEFLERHVLFSSFHRNKISAESGRRTCPSPRLNTKPLLLQLLLAGPLLMSKAPREVPEKAPAIGSFVPLCPTSAEMSHVITPLTTSNETGNFQAKSSFFCGFHILSTPAPRLMCRGRSSAGAAGCHCVHEAGGGVRSSYTSWLLSRK